jgi:hypothetical protein
MIENDSQRQRTLALMEGFRKAGAKLADDGLGKRSIAIRGSYAAIIRQLENELREYDDSDPSSRVPLPSQLPDS